MALIEKSGNAIVITSTNTSEQVLKLTDYQGGLFEALIEVTDGNFQFTVHEDDDPDQSYITSDNAIWETDDKLVLSFGTDKGYIRFKASASDKDFRITV